MAITEFKGRYECLSNFAPVIGYLTVEHWYQANRTNDVKWQQLILSAANAVEAKKFGNEVRKAGLDRPDWYSVNYDVMASLVHIKMILRPDYLVVLLETGEEEIVEGNWWHDNYWGKCVCEKCAGKEKLNKLGIIHMDLRALFRKFRVLPNLSQLHQIV